MVVPERVPQYNENGLYGILLPGNARRRYSQGAPFPLDGLWNCVQSYWLYHHMGSALDTALNKLLLVCGWQSHCEWMTSCLESCCI